MTTVIRWVAAGLIILTTVWLLRQEVWLPYRCNQQKKAAEFATREMKNRADPLLTARTARRELAVLEHCIRVSPHDVELYADKAELLRLIHRTGDAIEAYRRAVSIEPRPELYVELSVLEAEAGKDAEAVESLLLAAQYDRSYLRSARNGAVLEAVKERLESGSRATNSHP